MIGIADIEAAAERLGDVVVRTPLLQSAELDRAAGGTVLIKPECFQEIGSFKIRGAYNLLSQLTPEQAKKGVVAWSSGNHAQGVALAGKLLGIHAAIVMPADAPAAKLENTRRLGGEIIYNIFDVCKTTYIRWFQPFWLLLLLNCTIMQILTSLSLIRRVHYGMITAQITQRNYASQKQKRRRI